MRSLVLSSLLCATSAFSAEALPRVVVLDFTAPAAAESFAAALGGAVANELQRLGTFDVSTAEQARTILSLERQKSLLGGAEGALSALGKALDARYVITGEVLRLKGEAGGESWTLQLVLTDAAEAKRVASQQVSATSEGALISGIGAATLKLCSPLLAGRTGTFYVSASEAGAAVKIDGSLRGTTPLEGRVSLPAGPHLIEVEKEGFVTLRREVRIKPDEHVEEQASLVPSPDFIEQYERSAGRTRLGAHLATIVAVAGLGTAGYFQYRAGELFGAPSRAGTFAFHQAHLNEGVEEDELGSHRTEASRLKTEIETAQRFAWIAGGAGAAAAVGAVVLYVVGDPPGRYQRYVIVESASLLPIDGGGLATVSLRF